MEKSRRDPGRKGFGPWAQGRRSCRSIGATWLACASGAAAEPKAGQTIAEFEDAIVAGLAAQGDKMGYSFQPCALKPAFTASGQTYVGRAFSQRSDTVIVLVAVEGERVARWEEFDLPDIQGWITHGVVRCKGSTLEVAHGRAIQRYRWSGREFTKSNERPKVRA
jgi:hypothetical protein